MLVVDRTHPLRRDLDWVPGRLRAGRWLRRGGGLLLGGGLLGVAALTLPFGVGGLILPLAAGAATGLIGGDRLGAGWIRSRLEDLVHGERALDRLDDAAEGELVRVRGRVEIDEPLEGVLHGAPGACRRLAFKAGVRWWIHEAAVDFWLVDARGRRVLVQAAGARFLTALSEPLDYPARRFVGPTAPHGVRARFSPARDEPVIATERVLRANDEVTIVAHRTTTVDPTGEAAGYREPPTRASLAGTRTLPLIVALGVGPVGDAHP